MRFLFVCGGTAGHINPALSVASELRDRLPDAEFLFVGSGRELENRLVPAAGFRLKNIRMTGFNRGFSGSDIKHNLVTVRNLVTSRKEASAILREFPADAAIGTGGYVCYPIIKEAARRKIPTVLHESNAVPGLTTRMLSGTVTRMLVAFPEAAKHYRKPGRVVVTGTPVRRDFAPMGREEAKRKLGIIGKKLVVSFWGSLGADTMNSRMAEFIKLNARSGAMHHIHATGNGKQGVERMMARLHEYGLYGLPAWEEVRPYIDNMGALMTAADVVICRAGASTVAELTSIGRASVLVPSPYVTGHQQEKNASAVERAGGAVVLTENTCSGELLYNTVVGLLRDDERRRALEENARAIGEPDACRKIADEILAITG